MIARLEGILVEIDADTAIVRAEGGLTYQVLIPAYATSRLAGRLGQKVELHILHFLESHNQGSTFFPRFAGFLTSDDKAFYELFVTCKGIGHRKALRALAMETALIAEAIADRNLPMLQTLPEIGRRTAETIIASLRDKVERFISTSARIDNARVRPAGDGSVEPVAGSSGGMIREAIEVLVQLGENRAQVRTWIDQVMIQDHPPGDVESVIAQVYRIKSGG